MCHRARRSLSPEAAARSATGHPDHSRTGGRGRRPGPGEHVRPCLLRCRQLGDPTGSSGPAAAGGQPESPPGGQSRSSVRWLPLASVLERIWPAQFPPQGSGAARPHASLRAIDSSARPRRWTGLRTAPPPGRAATSAGLGCLQRRVEGDNPAISVRRLSFRLGEAGVSATGDGRCSVPVKLALSH